jgi:hypothetical protein
MRRRITELTGTTAMGTNSTASLPLDRISNVSFQYDVSVVVSVSDDMMQHYRRRQEDRGVCSAAWVTNGLRVRLRLRCTSPIVLSRPFAISCS